MSPRVASARAIRGAAIGLLLGLVAGCSFVSRPPHDSPTLAGAVLIRAINRSAGAIDLWIHARFHVHLGCVAAGEAKEYVVPANLPAGEGAVRLIAWPRPSGSPIASGPILLAPGRMVRFTVVEALEGPQSRSRATERDDGR